MCENRIYLFVVVFQEDALRYELVPNDVHFLETFIDGDFADPAYGFNLPFGNVEIARMRDEVNDPCRDGVRRVIKYNIFFFNFIWYEKRKFGEFLVYIEATAVAFNEGRRFDGGQFSLSFG